VAGLTGEKLEFTDVTGGKLVAVAVDGCLSGLTGQFGFNLPVRSGRRVTNVRYLGGRFVAPDDRIWPPLLAGCDAQVRIRGGASIAVARDHSVPFGDHPS
jgi:hypothetical protein